MQFQVYALSSRASWVLALCAWLCAACAKDEPGVVIVPSEPDSGVEDKVKRETPDPNEGCATVELDGDSVVEHLQDFTARFQLGTSYDRTVMLFGGKPVEQPNTPSRAYIFGLDKVDAQMMAKKYPDFYLCSSVGGEEAASYIKVYDIVPATCKIHQQLVTALRVYDANAARGGDRTSLRLQGSPLTVTSVIDNANGQDVKSQVSSQQFHLITAVQQLTGASLFEFGTEN